LGEQLWVALNDKLLTCPKAQRLLGQRDCSQQYFRIQSRRLRQGVQSVHQKAARHAGCGFVFRSFVLAE